MKFENITLDEMESVARKIFATIPKEAIVILKGPVGAGKTTFVKMLTNDATSPTYTLINSYDELIHLDLYRLEDARDLETLEIPLYLNEGKPIFVEWGEAYIEELFSIVGYERPGSMIEFIPSVDGGESRTVVVSKI